MAFGAFTPDPTRTLVWPQPAPYAVPGRPRSPLPVQWPPQASATAQDSSLDISDWLTNCDDTLQSATVAITGPDTHLGVKWVSLISGQVVAFLSGGTPNTTYAIELVLLTAQGRSETIQGTLFINNDSSQATPSGFSASAFWTTTPSLDFSKFINSGARMMGWN